MVRKQHPASYTVTATDLAQVVLEHAQEWDATAYFVLTLGRPDGPGAYVEVTLREGFFLPSGRELQRVRYPLDTRHAERWPANALHAVLAAYQNLEGDPWNWPAGRRKKLVGE